MTTKIPQPTSTMRRVATLAYWQVSRAWHLGEGKMTTQHALQTLGSVKHEGPQLARSADALIMQIVHKNHEPTTAKVAK